MKNDSQIKLPSMKSDGKMPKNLIKKKILEKIMSEAAAKNKEN